MIINTALSANILNGQGAFFVFRGLGVWFEMEFLMAQTPVLERFQVRGELDEEAKNGINFYFYL